MIVFLCEAIFVGGCSKQPPAPAPAQSESTVVTLASNDRGLAQLEYSGPGHLDHSSFNESFNFEIGLVGGIPWTTAKGEMKFSDTNHVTITLQSTSDRPYDIDLLGVWTNRTLDIPEDKAKEKVHVPAGEQKLKIDRFVIWTYDFFKDKYH